MLGLKKEKGLMEKQSNKTYPAAVVIGCNDASLGIIRSLGRKGIRIIGLYEDPDDYCLKTKYCTIKLERKLYGKTLVKELIGLSEKMKEPAVLFCATDNSVLTVSKYQKELEPRFHFVLSPYEVMRNQISKRKFYEFALANHFAVPKTFFTNAAEEITKVAGQVTYPCIVKPEVRSPTWIEKVPFKVLYAESKESFLEQARGYRIESEPLIVQEWIDGGDADVYFCLAYINRKFKPLALCTGRKLVQYPRLTGSTSIAETVRQDELANESLRLLKAAGVVGFCSVEFKYSRKSRRYYITEPTVGRPDTQEGLAICAGLDIPYIAYLDAIDHDPAPLGAQKAKTRWVNEPLAFYSLQETLRDGINLREATSLFTGSPSYGLCSWDDPCPAINFTVDKIYRGVRKLLKINPRT